MNNVLLDPFFIVTSLLIVVVFRMVRFVVVTPPNAIYEFQDSLRIEDWLVPFTNQNDMNIIHLVQAMIKYKQCKYVSFGAVCEMYLNAIGFLLQREWIEVVGDSAVKVRGELYPATYRITDTGMKFRDAYMYRENIKIPTA